jgi:hypothetical protein
VVVAEGFVVEDAGAEVVDGTVLPSVEISGLVDSDVGGDSVVGGV